MKYLLGLALSFFLMASLARADGVTVVLSIEVDGWPNQGPSRPTTESFRHSQHCQMQSISPPLFRSLVVSSDSVPL